VSKIINKIIHMFCRNSIIYSEGYKELTTSPDDIWDYCISHPDKYEVIQINMACVEVLTNE
jgi:hypothetical protein